MNADLLAALAAFALVATFSPGPNNMMLLASGANFGLRRSLPHMAGISVGFPAMVAGVGVGLMGLFEAVPAAHTVLKAASVLYMAWLAWKIANAAAPEGAAAAGRPLRFVEAAGFQWVNPKAWAMAMAAIAAYAPDRSLLAVALVAGVFAAVSVPSVSLWAAAGRGLRRVLSNPARLRAFNWAMAALLLASLWPVLRA